MSRTPSRFVGLSLMLLLMACHQTDAPTTANLIQPQEPTTSYVPNRWLVELKGDPTALSAQSITGQQHSFRALSQQKNIVYKEVYSYHQLFNGFSIEADQREIKRIAQLPGVKAVYPVELLSLPEPVEDESSYQAASETPETWTSRDLIGASEMHDFGITGKGIKVGIIDTGIDPNHPAFKGRILKNTDYVGDDYSGTNEPTPVENPVDCGGHGTHVAGIVAGNDPEHLVDNKGFKGIAPDAQLGIYRVFGCKGHTSADIIIRALEQTLRDGMQVVNMSLGSPLNNWSQKPNAMAASRLVKRGVIVITSAGNTGAAGAYAMGGSSMGENVISVASVDNIKFSALSISEARNKLIPTNISSFSSYGLSAELEVKPEVAAPGGGSGSMIYSTLPLDKGTYGRKQGTSMAAPHVAGAAALLLQARKGLTPQQVNTLLMNTASPRVHVPPRKGQVGTEQRNVSVTRIGAGVIDVVAAMNNRVYATPAKLRLMDSETLFRKTQVVTLTNTSNKDIAYVVKHEPAISVLGISKVTFHTAAASIKLNGKELDGTSQITVPAGKEYELELVFEAPIDAPEETQYSGHILLENKLDIAPRLSIPYAGYKGDFFKFSRFGEFYDRINEKTYLPKKLVSPILVDAEADKVYERNTIPETMPEYSFQEVPGKNKLHSIDQPLVKIHLTHQMRSLTFEVLNEQGTVVQSDVNSYLPRNCPAADPFRGCKSHQVYRQFAWDGTINDGSQAPEGKYRIRVTGLKPLGNASNPEHLETYTSPEFLVVRR